MPAMPSSPAPANCEESSTGVRPAPTGAPAPAGGTLEEARALFGADRFATEQLGARIDEAAPGRAVCSLEVLPCHRNAMGNVMGGAVFTLADFALAVASNFGQQPAVTVSSSIEYVAAAKGSRIAATCTADRAGRRLGFYTTRVEDDRGALVALVQATCMRV